MTTVRPQLASQLKLFSVFAFFLLACLALLGSGCDNRMDLQQFLKLQPEAAMPGPQPTTKPILNLPANPDLAPFRAGPGDVLTVTVTGEANETRTLQVRVQRDGTIELPLIEPVRVADMELEDVELAIKKKYTEKVYQSAVVHVEVVEPHGTDVLVTGAVSTPGLIHLKRNESNLLFSIVRAGGVSNTASGVVLLSRIRDPKKKVTLNMATPEGVRAALALPSLENGDMVSVEAATPNTIFVGGLVNVSGPQTYAPGVRTTALQAIAGASGLRTDVFPKEATLIRRLPNGQDLHVKLDLDRLGNGKDPNITLASGDILWVPPTWETRLQDWANKNLHVGANAEAGAQYQALYTRQYAPNTNTSVLIPTSTVP